MPHRLVCCTGPVFQAANVSSFLFAALLRPLEASTALGRLQIAVFSIVLIFDAIWARYVLFAPRVYDEKRRYFMCCAVFAFAAVSCALFAIPLKSDYEGTQHLFLTRSWLFALILVIVVREQLQDVLGPLLLVHVQVRMRSSLAV